MKESRCWIIVMVLAWLLPTAAQAGEHYAFVVSGASGAEKHIAQFDRWRTSIVRSLRVRFGFSAEAIVVLGEQATKGVEKATRENVRRALGDLRRRMTNDDTLIVMLVGHGTFDGTVAKFNLVGPDLEAAEWLELLKPMPGRLIVVDTTGASYPFLQSLSGKNRIVITATDSAAQRYDTMFPEFWAKALDDPSADLDKNGRISVWEAFTYVSAAVRQYYEQRGQLSTERALLDDNGDGLGKEAGAPGPDGAMARAAFLDADLELAKLTDARLAGLELRRNRLAAEVEALKAKKGSIPSEQFDADFETLMIELAKVSRQIRLLKNPS